MATLKRSRSSGAVSSFRQVAPEPGALFAGLAAAMDTAYQRLEPAAIKHMQDKAAEDWTAEAQRQVGDPTRGGERVSTSGGSFREALRRSESGGRQRVVNSEGYGGYFQWGQGRLDDYNRATGQNISMQQFLDDGEIQEGAQDWHEGDILSRLGGYVGREVGGQVMDEAAILGMAHLGGVGGAKRFIESGGAYNPADSNGTSLADYARKFAGLSVGGAERVSSMGDAAEPTLIRTKGGKLEARLYSPLSGPILQAYNAAAGVAYTSGALDKGIADMMAMSEQFPNDPNGFKQAADQYVKDLVGKAPSAMRGDLRAVLQKEVHRRFLGVTEDHHNDIRARAANSSKALIDRWSDTYAEALASGNTDAALDARAELDGLLRAREKLPGLAWTSAQSDNVFLASEKAAERLRKEAVTAKTTAAKKDLALVTEAAKAGQYADIEGIIGDEVIAAMLPEEMAEARSFVALRDNLGPFNALPPDEQDKFVQVMIDDPVDAGYEIDIAKAASAVATANRKAWETDPIAQAEKVLPQKPAPLPDLSTDPAQVQEALAARRAYANGLRDAGYTDLPAFLSDKEAVDLGAVFAKEMDPAVKAAAAGMIVAGFGEDAMQVFKEIKSDDPVTLMAGQAMAGGVDQAVAGMAIKGQQMIDAGLVQIPQKGTKIAAISDDIAEALEVARTEEQQQGHILEFATAIYAAQARGVDPTSDTAATLMAKSVQYALGQSTDRKGRITGGVQEIAGFQTLLPPKIAGDDVNEALEAAFMPKFDGIGSRFVVFPSQMPQHDPAIWEAIAGRAPVLDRSLFSAGRVRLVPVYGTTYRMEVQLSGATPLFVTDAEERLFTFDLNKLIEATR